MEAKVMGTDAHVVVPGRPDLESIAIERLRDLERRWSRFLSTSELSRLNAAAGEGAVEVSKETFDAVGAAIDAWHATDGAFDPTVHDSMVAAGYDRTFDALADVGPAAHVRPAPGCGGIALGYGSNHTIELPRGVRLDLGGIGKGLAADLVLTEVMAAGAEGGCVNVGGDLAVAGVAPSDDGWIVGLEDPFHAGREVLRLALSRGAVATTSRMRRRWQRGGERLHHVLDPRTGRPADTGVATATVIAASAAEAEVLAKVVFLDPAGCRPLLEAHDASAIVIEESRRVRCIGGVEAFAA